MTRRHESYSDDDARAATKALVALVDSSPVALTPAIAVALAEQLLHIAGGDGRGVYSVVHDPIGDRL